MIIWIAYCEDRHIDPEMFGFRDRDKAIEKAREYMRDHVAYPAELQEEEIDGVWYMNYAEESDHAFVNAVNINDV